MEWFTSHGFAPVRNLANSAVDRIQSMPMIYSSYLGGVTGFVPIFILGLSFSLSLFIAGYAGAIFFTAGFLSLLTVIMPIYYLGANSTDSYRLSCFVTMGEYIHDNLFKISWASRNYMIYLKTTNSGGAILICLIIFGCTGYES